MDRIESEERIRRAEDLLERRRNRAFELENETIEKSGSETKYKKLLIQIMVCMCIYCGLYYANNTQNDFFKGLVDKTNQVLSYDVNFKEIYNFLQAKASKLNIEVFKEKTNGQEVEDVEKEDDNRIVQNNLAPEENGEQSNDTTSAGSEAYLPEENLGIGGALEDEKDNNMVAKDQMQLDAEYIKENFNFINPLEGGIITSKFGARESNSIVSANHKGLDLGASTGSIIISAIAGNVIEASSEGDFGRHLKIQNQDIIVTYAHCSELLVKEGDYIEQGMQIAKVGATGKATGPHLHFEVRRDSRAVDPQMILDFN